MVDGIHHDCCVDGFVTICNHCIVLPEGGLLHALRDNLGLWRALSMKTAHMWHTQESNLTTPTFLQPVINFQSPSCAISRRYLLDLTSR